MFKTIVTAMQNSPPTANRIMSRHQREWPVQSSRRAYGFIAIYGEPWSVASVKRQQRSPAGHGSIVPMPRVSF